MVTHRLFSVAVGLVVVCCSQAHGRKWTDGTGQYTVEAEFVELVGEMVRLRRSNGEVIDVPLEKLSRSDQQYARQLARSSTEPADWVSLFNGRDLTGWRGDPKLWRVEQGAIVGEAPAGVISNLCTQRTYEDFVLKLKFKLTAGNSGVMVRSRELDDYKLTGPLVNIPAKLDWLALEWVPPARGGLWMQRAEGTQAAKYYRRNDWNEYVITCQGPRISVRLNGCQTTDYVDRSALVDRAGSIGLQLFAPNQSASVLFKDIRMRRVEPRDIARVTARPSPPLAPVALRMPEPVPLPDVMPEPRFLELQEGNDCARTQIRPGRLGELADNRIGDARGPALGLNQPVENSLHLLDHVEQCGFKWLRLSMDALEEGELDRAAYPRFEVSPRQDAMVKLLRNQGVTIVYTIVYWDETRPVGKRHPGYRHENEIQQYVDYARFIVRHFKGLIQYYEILNEASHWGVEFRDYVNLVRRVAPVIRQEDPNAEVVAGGTTGLGGTRCREWMLRLVSSDVIRLVDGVGLHPMYGASPQSETRDHYYGYPSLMAQMKRVATAHGFKGEWLASEMCWRTAKNPNSYEPWQYTEIAAAKYYARAIVMHLGMDFMTGIAQSEHVRPTARVVQNLCTVMAGNKPANLPLDVHGGVERLTTYTFSLPDGERLIVVWDDNVAEDHDRGEPSTVTVKGFSARKVTAIDVLYSSEQEMITDTEGGDLVIRNLLVKDYPIILRLKPGF